MNRDLMESLLEWKTSPRRKPLILNGARQVGKTWLLKEFGRSQFDNMAYLPLDNDATARSFFDPDYNVDRIIKSLALHLGMEIKPQDTLVVFDEVQACPKAITSLKYFCENAPEYAVVAAGSLLGILDNTGSGYPVGKVNTLDLYPLTFGEFLRASGEGRLADLIDSGDQVLMDSFSKTLTDLLRRYYVVGGMPEAVSVYAQTGDLAQARSVQDEILDGYVRDFSKHVPARLLARTLLVWQSIPAHLSRENKKFVFGQLRKGARAADFEESLAWLEHASLIHKVLRVSKPGLPLSAYAGGKAFKVFTSDVGLLGAMSGIEPKTILEGDRVFTEFKGALTEQYVCQSLVAMGRRPYYWSAEESTGEIDFLVQDGGLIYPIEVKAEENLRARSLRAFCDMNDGMQARRFSLSGFRDQGWMRNVPLWAIGSAANWLVR